MVSIKAHWAEYAMETAGLACFMVSALGFTSLMEHPASPAREALANPVLRRALTGVAMGLTAAAIIYSPWGRRSGAHLNPSVTLSYFRLGKISATDAGCYVVAQFIGGAAGVALVTTVMRGVVSSPAVNYVATVPGTFGPAAAFAGELVISFGMMSLILIVSNTRQVAHLTGVVAALLIALYITIEAPLSGMSMNPARSLGPALAAGAVGPLWIYFIAPPLGMLLAAELYVRRNGRHAVRCAKLHHAAGGPCHFACAIEGRTS
jgi:aquaporin Z